VPQQIVLVLLVQVLQLYMRILDFLQKRLVFHQSSSFRTQFFSLDLAEIKLLDPLTDPTVYLFMSHPLKISTNLNLSAPIPF
jgi:hypothetical protein